MVASKAFFALAFAAAASSVLAAPVAGFGRRRVGDDILSVSLMPDSSTATPDVSSASLALPVATDTPSQSVDSASGIVSATQLSQVTSLPSQDANSASADSSTPTDIAQGLSILFGLAGAALPTGTAAGADVTASVPAVDASASGSAPPAATASGSPFPFGGHGGNSTHHGHGYHGHNNSTATGLGGDNSTDPTLAANSSDAGGSTATASGIPAPSGTSAGSATPSNIPEDMLKALMKLVSRAESASTHGTDDQEAPVNVTASQNTTTSSATPVAQSSATHPPGKTLVPTPSGYPYGFRQHSIGRIGIPMPSQGVVIRPALAVADQKSSVISRDVLAYLVARSMEELE